jgi:hypothetical protein
MGFPGAGGILQLPEQRPYTCEHRKAV